MKRNDLWGSGLSPFFQPEDFLPSHPSVREDLETEVLIVGGGISGFLCAYELLKSGKSVTLVTENTVGDGASRFCTGILSPDGGPELLQLQQRIGWSAAASWFRFALAAPEQLEKIVRDTGSKCDFQRQDQFYYTASERDAADLREEYRFRRHTGADCRFLEAAECRDLFSFPCAGGILTRGGARFNGVKFCRDLADWVTLRGGSVYEGSRVDSIEFGADGKFCCRCGSFSIRADRVIDARGGAVLAKRPGLGQRITVFSIVSEPISVFRGWPEQCLIKSRDTIAYLRTTPDGRIVFSGEASSALSPGGKVGRWDGQLLCRVKYRNLEAELQEAFFGIPRIRREYAFSQGMVLPRKGLPYVGQDPQWKGLYYLYAFGEAGLAGALLGSAWINRMICDPSAKIPGYLSL